MYSVNKYIDYEKIKEFIKLANASENELSEMSKFSDDDDINLNGEIAPFTKEKIQSGEVVQQLCSFLNHYEIDYMVDNIDLLHDDYSRKSLLKYKNNIDKKLNEIRLSFANDTLYEYFLNMDFIELLKFEQVFNYFSENVELTNYGKEIKSILFNVIKSKTSTMKRMK